MERRVIIFRTIFFLDSYPNLLSVKPLGQWREGNKVTGTGSPASLNNNRVIINLSYSLSLFSLGIVPLSAEPASHEGWVVRHMRTTSSLLPYTLAAYFFCWWPSNASLGKP